MAENDEGKAKIEDGAQSNQENRVQQLNSDQIAKENTIDQRPITRFSYLLIGHKESHYIKKTLNADETNPTEPVLCLTDWVEASILLDCPQFFDSINLPSSVTLHVRDEENGVYNMRLERKSKKFSFTTGWKEFLDDHKLKPGDEITFYKCLDISVFPDGYYYILKYVRRGAKDDGPTVPRKFNDNLIETEQLQKSKENAATSQKPAFKVSFFQISLEEKGPNKGQGSRDFPLEACCLTKALNSSEVERNGKLYFDTFDAVLLTDDPTISKSDSRKYLKSLLMFDEDNESYKMRLSHFFTGADGSGMYMLTGWHIYLRKYNLKDGDEVKFYKVLDADSGCYYVIKFVRKQLAKNSRRWFGVTQVEDSPQEGEGEVEVPDQIVEMIQAIFED